MFSREHAGHLECAMANTESATLNRIMKKALTWKSAIYIFKESDTSGRAGGLNYGNFPRLVIYFLAMRTILLATLLLLGTAAPQAAQTTASAAPPAAEQSLELVPLSGA